METNYTQAIEFTLPSKGLIYEKKINPIVKLRSMTTQEEMQRLGHTETPYKTMCEIIENCIVGDKLGMPVYDLSLGDYQFLLHKLRIVTYGPDYKMMIRCPKCLTISEHTINLETLKINEYDEEFDKMRVVKLPISQKEITLRIQTPRMLDKISLRAKEMKKKNKEVVSEVGLLLTLESIIEKIDGVEPNPITLEKFVREMPMRDANILIQKAGKLNEKVGIDNSVSVVCKNCINEIVTSFRITSEFFGPTVD